MHISLTTPLKLTLATLLSAVLLAATLSSLLPGQASAQLRGSDFNAGRIIDDAVFFNSNSMTAAQIQSFLNARVPNCDTWGQRMYNSTQTRAQWAAANNRPAPPYVCLRNFSQNVPTVTNSGSNLCTGNISGGNKSAAQIIHDVARACGINPQVLIVKLQKEMSLVTDDWPWPRQYEIAMGYGCPDSGPNFSANCNANFYGFFNQVYQAAQAFKRYEANPTWYNYRAGRNNTIQWHPNPACGTSTVFIENQATANLYIYTPYRPNKAALNNLYGTGDSCSAYGNRNFWRLFNDWFGSTSSSGVSSVINDDTTDKTGEQASFGFRLSQRPHTDVHIRFELSDSSLARIRGRDRMVIRPNNWDQPSRNTLTIVGLNSSTTGPIEYELRAVAVSSSDSRFNNLNLEKIAPIKLLHLDTQADAVVHRMYSASLGRHKFTASDNDRQQSLANGWAYEGAAFRYCQAGEQTVVMVSKETDERLVIRGGASHRQLLATGFSDTRLEFSVSRQGNIPVYWLFDIARGRSIYSTNPNEGQASGFTNQGVAFHSCPIDHQPVYRLYRPTTGYFLTTSPAERDRAITDLGYDYEKLGFYTCANGAIDMYRLYRRQNGHFYTTSAAERDRARSLRGYQYDGVVFRLCAHAQRDVYRLFRPSTGHLYTSSPDERERAIRNNGYQYDGVVFRVQ
jgi:hypothetical protein